MNIDIDTGRIGENIVANELLSKRFLVTHLDKGTRSVSPNADLLVGHPESKKSALIQVKATQSPNLTFIFLAGISSDMITGRTPIFNSKTGFKADFIAAVSYKSNKEYRLFIIPVTIAEQTALKILRLWYRNPKKDGSQRAAMPKCYADLDDKPVRQGQEIRFQMRQLAREAFLKYEWRATDTTDSNSNFLQLLG